MSWFKRLFRKRLFIVYEDSHGAVSWWTSERKALQETKRILKDVYCSDCTDECNGVDTCDFVYIRYEFLNTPWRW